jgi:hypothetical protein
MSEPRKSTPSIKKIAEYWIKNSEIYETDLNFDWLAVLTNEN